MLPEPMGARARKFDYRFATEEDIVRLGKLLVGARLGSIRNASFKASTGRSGKGEVGLAVEGHFGIPPNARSEADFPGAGIELKIVPVVRSGSSYRVKERTVISMINYGSIINENWANAHVRSKLDILFVFFEHVPDRPKSEFPILAVHLWRPDRRTQALLRDDWERVQAKVREGRAHELRESDGRLMGPCTKGATGAVRVPQPITHLSPTAKPRAFALKPAFTFTLFQEARSRRGGEESLIDKLGVEPPRFEAALFARFEPHVGRQLGQVARQLGVPESVNKSYAAGVVRRILGVSGSNTPIREFEEMGIQLRVPRVRPDGHPYEAISFPAFKHLELVEEDWVDSELLARLDGILFVPLEGTTRTTPPVRCTLRRPFLWRPNVEQLAIAEREWTMFRNLIRAGKADRMPRESETEMIHVRPHGRDASDTDIAPGVGPVTKKSFWLNKAFVAELVREHSGRRRRG